MHGIIFSELKRYASEKYGGEGTWQKLLETAGLPNKVFLPTRAYADEDALKLVTAASNATGKPAQVLLEDFGAFIVPSLIATYGALIPATWKTLDTIENTEQMIHRVVRMRDASAAPPELRVTRKSPEEVVVHYASQRKMCAVARGIARGLAEHFSERILVSEASCMLGGARECEIRIRKA